MGWPSTEAPAGAQAKERTASVRADLNAALCTIAMPRERG